MLDIFDVKEYGAKGDGVTVDTKAIQNAIDDCFEADGGYVVLAGGTFVSGTIFVKSNVYLQVNPSATLLANPDISDYPEGTHYNRYVNEKDMDKCFIYAEDATNIGVIGQGEINGNAESFPNEGSIYRPMMMRFLRCKNFMSRVCGSITRPRGQRPSWTARIFGARTWTSATPESTTGTASIMTAARTSLFPIA